MTLVVTPYVESWEWSDQKDIANCAFASEPPRMPCGVLDYRLEKQEAVNLPGARIIILDLVADAQRGTTVDVSSMGISIAGFAACFICGLCIVIKTVLSSPLGHRCIVAVERGA